MQFVAKARYVRYSPYKLRPLADVVRGKKVPFALSWLATSSLAKARSVYKVIESAVANAYSLKQVSAEDLVIKEIKVDQGPMYRYFKPGAQGRANIYRRRLCHLSIVLQSVASEEA